MNDSSKPPVFIVGCPRSGTTLLRLIMDSHPNLAIAPESSFVFRMTKFLPLYGDFNNATNLKNFLGDILKIDRVKAWFPTDVTVEELIKEIGSEVNVSNIYNIVYSAYAKSRRKKRWGDKTPKNLFSVPKIKELFPDAKIIVVVRDGRDVALSLNKVDFGRTKIITSAYEWRKYVRFAGLIEGDYPENIYKVKYEDLLRNPEQVLDSIFDFIGEEYEGNLIDKYLEHEDDVTHSKSEFYGKQLSPENIDKWKKIMNHDVLANFEKIAGEELLGEGYKLSGESTGLSESWLKILVKVDRAKRMLNSTYNKNALNWVAIVWTQIIRRFFNLLKLRT